MAILIVFGSYYLRLLPNKYLIWFMHICLRKSYILAGAKAAKREEQFLGLAIKLTFVHNWVAII